MTAAHTWTLWIPDAANLAERASAVLSVDEQRRAHDFRYPDDRRNYVVSHVWLRDILGGLLGVPPIEVPISSAPCIRCGGGHGKPQLPSDTGLHFSLSHAGQVAMVAAAGSPIGVDVEVIAASGSYVELLDNLAPEERAALQAVPTTMRDAAFTQCWVRKEAYLKATGEGLNREPRLAEVGLGSRFGGPPTPSKPIPWRVIDLDAPDGYAAAMAVTWDAR